MKINAFPVSVARRIVAGDLNDVAWSRTTRLLQELSGLLDPRIERGPHSTFNANWPFLRWPLDHVVFEKSFQLRELKVVENIGSDHFPLFVALCHRPEVGRERPADPDGPVAAEAEEAIREGREEARKRRLVGRSRATINLLPAWRQKQPLAIVSYWPSDAAMTVGSCEQ